MKTSGLRSADRKLKRGRALTQQHDSDSQKERVFNHPKMQISFSLFFLIACASAVSLVRQGCKIGRDGPLVCSTALTEGEQVGSGGSMGAIVSPHVH